ncbi:MAG: hypothetical protein ACRDIB_07955 [Ardenticatenaceae bacterium]
MQLTLPNEGSEPLEDAVLRLYGNAETIYTGSQMTAGNVRVMGQLVDTVDEAGETALRILLPEPLEPGQSTTITFPKGYFVMR